MDDTPLDVETFVIVDWRELSFEALLNEELDEQIADETEIARLKQNRELP